MLVINVSIVYTPRAQVIAFSLLHYYCLFIMNASLTLAISSSEAKREAQDFP